MFALRKLARPIEVTTAVGSCVVSEIGSILALTKSRGRTITIHNVYYYPNGPNVLSLRLLKENFLVLTGEKYVFLEPKDENKDPLLVVRENFRGLHMLHLQPLQPFWNYEEGENNLATPPGFANVRNNSKTTYRVSAKSEEGVHQVLMTTYRPLPFKRESSSRKSCKKGQITPKSQKSNLESKSPQSAEIPPNSEINRASATGSLTPDLESAGSPASGVGPTGDHSAEFGSAPESCALVESDCTSHTVPNQTGTGTSTWSTRRCTREEKSRLKNLVLLDFLKSRKQNQNKTKTGIEMQVALAKFQLGNEESEALQVSFNSGYEHNYVPRTILRYAHQITTHETRRGIEEPWTALFDGAVATVICGFRIAGLKVAFAEEAQMNGNVILGGNFLLRYGVNPLDIFFRNAALGSFPGVTVVDMPEGGQTRLSDEMISRLRTEGQLSREASVTAIGKAWSPDHDPGLFPFPYQPFSPCVASPEFRNLMATDDDFRKDLFATARADQELVAKPLTTHMGLTDDDLRVERGGGKDIRVMEQVYGEVEEQGGDEVCASEGEWDEFENVLEQLDQAHAALDHEEGVESEMEWSSAADDFSLSEDGDIDDEGEESDGAGHGYNLRPRNPDMVYM